jgi:hypothetical protein
VIGCAFTVLNTLGAGFLEKVYENALAYDPNASDLRPCLLLTSASRAWRSNAWPMAYKPRRVICVFCVHRLPASALKFLS